MKLELTANKIIPVANGVFCIAVIDTRVETVLDD